MLDLNVRFVVNLKSFDTIQCDLEYSIWSFLTVLNLIAFNFGM
jgi:hypothetical protein